MWRTRTYLPSQWRTSRTVAVQDVPFLVVIWMTRPTRSSGSARVSPLEAGAPLAVFELPGEPSRERPRVRLRFWSWPGRGRLRSGRREGPHRSGSAPQLLVQGGTDQGADPGAEVDVTLGLEPIQARPQLLIEADSKDFHRSRLSCVLLVAYRATQDTIDVQGPKNVD